MRTFFPADETRTYWVVRDTYRVTISGDDTDGGFALVDASVLPGGGPPLHIHHVSDESYYVISGELEVTIGDEQRIVGPNDSVFIPKGTPHGFTNPGIHPTRMVFSFAPAGPEQVFVHMGDDPVPGQIAPAWGPERYTPEVVEAGLRWDTEIVPPPDPA